MVGVARQRIKKKFQSTLVNLNVFIFFFRDFAILRINGCIEINFYFEFI